MTEEQKDNPYEAPSPESGKANEGPRREKRLFDLIFGLVLAIGATLLTFALPTIAVPAALLLMPFALRTLEVNRVRTDSEIGMSGGDWAKLIAISLVAAIPIGAASLLLFCCVCTPIGFAAATIKSYQYGPTTLGLGIAVFIGMVLALRLGYFILRRSNYLSEEVKMSRYRRS